VFVYMIENRDFLLWICEQRLAFSAFRFSVSYIFVAH